jgi:DNA-binding PadR family transcriptional regulator
MVTRIDDVSYMVLRCYLPYLILKVLMVKGSCSAYDVIEVIKQSLNHKFSAGSVYNTLNVLERKGYVKRSAETPLVELTAEGKALALKALRESETVTAKIHDFLKGA